MTKEEAIEQLKSIESGDTEACHCIADDILCEFLRSLGYGDVVDEWDNVDKWYA